MSLIPPQYKIGAAIVAISAILAYAYHHGYASGKAVGDAEIAKLISDSEELKNALEKEQQNIKEKIVTEYVDKVKVVKEKEYVYVDQAKNVVPSQYNLSNGWVYVHDASLNTRGVIPDATRASDATASDVKDNQALVTILGNYSVCLQNAQQLTSLQQYVLDTKKSIDEQNANRKLKLPWK
jgi:hypothetical protein